MEKLLIMDAHNYDPDLEEIYRVSVREIIFIDGKLLMIEDSFGETKLPGGGVDGIEDDCQTLAREETGFIFAKYIQNRGFAAIRKMKRNMAFARYCIPWKRPWRKTEECWKRKGSRPGINANIRHCF